MGKSLSKHSRASTHDRTAREGTTSARMVQNWPQRSRPMLYHAHRSHRLATAGPCARVRHPQYAGFSVIMFGFLLRWPTLLKLIMFPDLGVTYVLLARSEERAALDKFGEEYRTYMARTPA